MDTKGRQSPTSRESASSLRNTSSLQDAIKTFDRLDLGPKTISLTVEDLIEAVKDYCEYKGSRSYAIKQSPSVEMTAEDDWQRDMVHPVQRISKLYSMGHLTDVTITFEGCDVTYKAHRLILATASVVLEKMFYSDTIEARTGLVRFVGVSPVAVRWLLDNLYTGKTDLVNVMTAIRIFNFAQMYQINGVVALCREYLRYEVSLANVCDVFDVALTHSEEMLMTACIKKLCSSWTEVLNEHIANMTEGLWLHMLKRTILPTSEVQLFRGLYIWGKAQLEAENKSTTPQDIRSRIQKFICHLRLLSIPSDKFIDYIMPTKIFTSEECSSILLKLRGFETPLPRSVRCSNLQYSRIDASEGTLRYVVLNRQTDGKKLAGSAISELTLIRNLSVSNSILLHQIQTQDNATLKYAQMILTDSEDMHVGIAKSSGAQWKFSKPAFLYANKSYKVCIDKVLVNKIYVKREFCTYSNDIRFKGDTGDNYLKLSYWPAHPKNY